ncbi:hypothetical protein HZB02_02700 [Candidatus Woesearchaeota archaeon]|nr:hypothetical protein [Candidatus Woesearchaeota archaeon]
MLNMPESVEECIYFTRRIVGKGNIVAWVSKQDCPQCKKAKMGKPRDNKGKVKIRAKEYTCPTCKYTAEKEAYEETLTCDIMYTCPKCLKQGEQSVPFKRKKVKIFDSEEGTEKKVDAVAFACSSCKEKLYVTKKMK